MSSPAGAWTRARSASPRPSPASTAAARRRLATSATYGTPARNAAASTGSSSRPCEATTTARRVGAVVGTRSARTISYPSAAADLGQRPGDRRVAEDMHQRRRQTMASRKISRVPPDRHGLRDA